MHSGIFLPDMSDAQMCLVSTAFGIPFISESRMCTRLKFQAETCYAQGKGKLASVMCSMSAAEREKHRVVRK